MTRMVRRRGAVYLLVAFLSVPSALAQTLPRGNAEDAGLSSARLERLTRALNEYVEKGQLAGAVAVILRDGKVVYSQAVGKRDVQGNQPMQLDTMFRIASQTKALVSVAVMMLQEEGRLTLSDPAGRFLPEFQETTVAVPKDGGGYDVVKARRPITIRDLLTHTAGIGYGGGTAADRWKAAGITGWYLADRDEPVGATVARMGALPMEAQPGEKWVYGYSADILGAIVERVSGETLDVFLQQRILTPLGMADTHFYVPPAKARRLAVVYTRDASGALVPAPDPGGMVGQGEYVDGPRRSFSGGAGLVSTAQDYARFLQMLLNGGELDGARILSRKSVELMTVDHVGHIPFRPGEGFGLGFSIVKDLGARGAPGSVGEYGWGGAYHSTYWVDPRERMVVLYFTQLIPAGGIDDYAKLRALVYQAIEK